MEDIDWPIPTIFVVNYVFLHVNEVITKLEKKTNKKMRKKSKNHRFWNFARNRSSYLA